MRQKTLDKYNKVKALIDDGWTQTDALTKCHMAAPTFLKIKNGRALVPVHKKVPEYIDLVAKEESNVMIVVCKPDQIRSVLGELK